MSYIQGFITSYIQGLKVPFIQGFITSYIQEDLNGGGGGGGVHMSVVG